MDLSTLEDRAQSLLYALEAYYRQRKKIEEGYRCSDKAKWDGINEVLRVTEVMRRELNEKMVKEYDRMEKEGVKSE